VTLLAAQASAADLKPKTPPPSDTEEAAPSKKFLNTLTPATGQEHRYLFVGAVISASIGFGLTYWAQGEVRRANSLNLAVDSRRTYQTAQATISGANVLFAVAGAFAVYGLLAELLPRDSGADGSLTLNF
jgi:hypothetical protein